MSTKILGIETSCDETAVAVVEDGRRVLSNIIASQVDIHARYGGIVPEVASRQHILQITPTIGKAMEEARVSMKDIEAVAVTYGPGLAGSLLVGLNVAKAIAYSIDKPLIGINHLEGHIHAAWLEYDSNLGQPDPGVEPGFPLVCLIASGGHTDLVLMEGQGQYTLLGRTRDDAAGEAFDKAARILGLGFPGGPEIQRVSESARGEESLPRAWMKNTSDFSFSGVKTALLHKAQDKGIYPRGDSEQDESEQAVKEMAAAFQDSVVDVMVVKTLEAADRSGARGIILGGGVAANALLRSRMTEESPLPTLIPSPVLCTDNGAMIAASGWFHYVAGTNSPMDLDVDPGLPLATSQRDG